MKRTGKKSFRQLYEEAKAKPTPVDRFLRRITGMNYSLSAARSWLSGHKPGKGVMAALEREFDTPAEILFPEWAAMTDEGEDEEVEAMEAEAMEAENEEVDERRLEELAKAIEIRSEVIAERYAKEQEVLTNKRAGSINQ